MKRLLWLSDIHLDSEKVKVSRDTKDLLGALVAKISELGPIDVVVISGDIAMSGEDSQHYLEFFTRLVKPVKEMYPNVKFISVPGNHDVNWKRSEQVFLSKLVSDGIELSNLSAIKDSLDDDYFEMVFPKYKKFHDDHMDNTCDEKFFNNLFAIEDIVFVNINSAWLSVGNPINEINEIGKSFSRSKSLGIDSFIYCGESETKPVFNEFGNQTYGFNIKFLKSSFAKLEEELRTSYMDHFKIFVAHHPCNNWLHWNELYTHSGSAISTFHRFIKDNRIDLILTGHEHTSLVEGSVLFGEALDLKGGMLLDHHGEDFSNSWFKTIDIVSHENVSEHSFYYNHADKIWENKANFDYEGWKSICRQSITLDDSIHFNSVETETTLPVAYDFKFSRAEFETMILNPPEIGNYINGILSLFGEDFKWDSGKVIKEGLFKYSAKANPKDAFVYIIGSIRDLFADNLDKINEESYINILLADLSANSPNTDVFIFYAYSVASQPVSIPLDEIDRILRKKFEHFRDTIFRNEICINKLKNAKFALRKV